MEKQEEENGESGGGEWRSMRMRMEKHEEENGEALGGE